MKAKPRLKKAKQHNPRRLRAWALSIGIVSALGLVVQLLCASMVQEGGIVAKLDLSPKSHNLVLHSTPPISTSNDAEPLRRIVAPGLSNAKPTSAKKALEFYSSLREEDLAGSRKDGEGEVQNALVFTFYVENVSEDGDESFSYHVSLADVQAPQNGATHPYSYLRLALFADTLGSNRHQHAFYGAPNSLGEGTYHGGESDNRECISEYTRYQEGDVLLRKPVFLDGDEGYCVNFRPGMESIIAVPLSLGPKETMRLSLLAYFEGFDPDCIREAPVGASLGLTISLGEDYA